MKRKLIKINKEGSIAIVLPKQLCAAMGLKPGTELEVSLNNKGQIVLEKQKV